MFHHLVERGLLAPVLDHDQGEGVLVFRLTDEGVRATGPSDCALGS
jgi:hypothetical protein